MRHLLDLPPSHTQQEDGVTHCVTLDKVVCLGLSFPSAKQDVE